MKYKYLITTTLIFCVLSISAQNKITQQQFFEQQFLKNISLKSLDKEFRLFGKISKIPTQNPHTKAIDTTYVFSYFKSKFYFFKTPEKELFFKAEINNRRIKLINGIKIGMKKSDFEKKFSKTFKASKKSIKKKHHQNTRQIQTFALRVLLQKKQTKKY